MIGKVIFISVLVLVLQHIFTVVHFFGVLTTVYTHYPGECRQIPGIDIGAEDFHTLKNGLTFITTGFRFQEHSAEAEKYFKEANRKGRMYLFDFNHPEKNVVELILTSTKVFNRETFSPHGLSAWEDKKTKRVFLFVVSHRHGQGDSIEKFLYVADKQRLHHVKTYEGSDSFKFLNDVAATGENSFYFTNYLCWTSRPLMMVQYFFLIRCSDVVYYDGSTYQSVSGRLGGANGISLSNDGKFVYVSAVFEKEIKVYKRETNGALTLAQSWSFGTAVDNMAVHPETGDVYCAAHPIPYKFLEHDDNPRVKRSPSQVLQLKVKGDNLTSVQELFVDATGDLISGSSTALVYKNKLLIGSVLHKLVLCDVNIPL
ncbi:serum paraoxonase/arylesterase 2-like [Gigantopelta aegis]|uniref:serum paraoxonase/arylesterase 2-like n=1 Tax=Gigantopelta aegis TaxID=1735272 RepID=UPI001B88E52F|nr:serum paraoxonase/arylesterase 2-like [Gigantopelta aegis]XP_041374821.1 serum paraoxonase/arylesterase 2-like [Gigantopelta aegis]